MSQGLNSKYDDIIPFIKENQERFYRFAYRYMRNSDASIEVVQEAIVKALEKIHTLRKREYLKTWFYRILINECITNIRKNKKLVFLEQYDEVPYNDTTIDKKELASIVFKAIDNLDPKYKTIILLRFYEDMMISDIAEVLKINVNTVKSRLYRALDILKNELKNEDIQEYDIFSMEGLRKE